MVILGLELLFLQPLYDLHLWLLITMLATSQQNSERKKKGLRKLLLVKGKIL